MGNLGTTNLLLGLMAAVSLIEGVFILAVSVAAWRAYRHAVVLIAGLEHRHVAPAMERINAILDDVKVVSTTVRAETERVDQTLNRAIDRVDDTAHRVQASVRTKVSRIFGLVLGVRTAIEYFLHPRREAAAGGP